MSDMNTYQVCFGHPAGAAEESPTMPQSSSSLQNAFNPIHDGHRWRSPKVITEERVVKITRDAEPAFRVFVVDRDSMSSDLLASTLVRERDCDAVAIQPGDLLPALAENQISLVVIGVDIDSKPGSGFDLANAVCRAHPNIFVVILLNQTSRESVINAFRSGARGVISRQLPVSEFLDCVEHVGKGFIWAGRQETNALLEAFKSIPAPSVPSGSTSPTLTVREMQVVQCAAKGMTNKTIAGELNLSEHTVKNYLFRAFEKLGVSSRVELLFYLTIRGHSFSAAKAEFVQVDEDNV
jgi:two-component system, NarL family, nitrate/nitrite response regulator NarL